MAIPGFDEIERAPVSGLGCRVQQARLPSTNTQHPEASLRANTLKIRDAPRHASGAQSPVWRAYCPNLPVGTFEWIKQIPPRGITAITSFALNSIQLFVGLSLTIGCALPIQKIHNLHMEKI